MTAKSERSIHRQAAEAERAEFDALLKVGGSLYQRADLRRVAACWSELAARKRLLVVPGGGPFADQVRAADARFGLDPSAAHWMALLAMDQYAYLLADLVPGAVIVRDLASAAACCAAGRLALLAPSALMLQCDPLPHSWAVSSDAIAAWLAGYARIELLVMLKSVAGVVVPNAQGQPLLLRQIARAELSEHPIVDPLFARTLPEGIACWLIDGGQPARLAELLESGETVGTRVGGEK